MTQTILRRILPRPGALLSFLTLFLCPYFEALAEEPTEPVRIGLLQSLTGIAAVDGDTVVKAAKLAAKEINQSGVSPQLELLIQDDHADAKNSVSAYHQIAQSKPDAIIGGTWSYIANALSPLAIQTVLLQWKSEFKQFSANKHTERLFIASATASRTNFLLARAASSFTSRAAKIAISFPISLSWGVTNPSEL